MLHQRVLPRAPAPPPPRWRAPGSGGALRPAVPSAPGPPEEVERELAEGRLQAGAQAPRERRALDAEGRFERGLQRAPVQVGGQHARRRAAVPGDAGG